VIDIYLYIPPHDATNDAIERALEDCLGDRGEVTGSGAGAFGMNIDIAIDRRSDLHAVVQDIRRVLKMHDVPRQTQIVVDGEMQLLQ
jgi:hypothetical protein